MKNPIVSVSSAALVLGGFATAAALAWLNRSPRSRRPGTPYVADTEPTPESESWSRDWIYKASPDDAQTREASESEESPSSESNLLEIDREIYDEMNPAPSARYERLYLMDHLGPEEAYDPTESDDLASAWLRRATQGTSPREQATVSAFDVDGSDAPTVIDLSASTLEEGEIVPQGEHRARSGRPRL